MAVMLLCCVL